METQREGGAEEMSTKWAPHRKKNKKKKSNPNTNPVNMIRPLLCGPMCGPHGGKAALPSAERYSDHTVMGRTCSQYIERMASFHLEKINWKM